ncbi:hypothetical protein R1flu_003748 [Riccia fluitans]|uniref:Uncharacterized protein n=1 Tax=Riccia fluitans TaxID=41844 RepID=A0ABD1Y9X0_9MARC
MIPEVLKGGSAQDKKFCCYFRFELQILESDVGVVEISVQNLGVACAELATLRSGRTAYEKRGSLFFRTDVKILNTSQQRELKKVKARLEKL